MLYDLCAIFQVPRNLLCLRPPIVGCGEQWLVDAALFERVLLWQLGYGWYGERKPEAW
jgi:hypothetical protein